MQCAENSETNDEMDGVEVIDLCGVSQMKNGELRKGKGSTKQEIEDEIKSRTIVRNKVQNRPEKGKPMA